MNIAVNINRIYWHLRVNRWQITLFSRAWADDALGCYDAGALAYYHDGDGERSVRLPFVGIFWGSR
ncbi:MAG: hypothetical protein ACK4S8_14940 [Alishewanella aestuarii]